MYGLLLLYWANSDIEHNCIIKETSNPTFSQYGAALTLTSVEWGMQKRKGIQLSVLTLCPCIKFTINTTLTNQSVIMPPTVLKSLWYVCRLIVFNKYLGNSSRIWPLVWFSVSKTNRKSQNFISMTRLSRNQKFSSLAWVYARQCTSMCWGRWGGVFCECSGVIVWGNGRRDIQSK